MSITALTPVMAGLRQITDATTRCLCDSLRPSARNRSETASAGCLLLSSRGVAAVLTSATPLITQVLRRLRQPKDKRDRKDGTRPFARLAAKLTNSNPLAVAEEIVSRVRENVVWTRRCPRWRRRWLAVPRHWYRGSTAATSSRLLRGRRASYHAARDGSVPSQRSTGLALQGRACVPTNVRMTGAASSTTRIRAQQGPALAVVSSSSKEEAAVERRCPVAFHQSQL